MIVRQAFESHEQLTHDRISREAAEENGDENH
jgi:hypothetical protein